MAKTKKDEIIDLKPETINKEHLTEMQTLVSRTNEITMQLGRFEASKHTLLHHLAGVNDEMVLLKSKLQKEYGTDDINIMDGAINYKENGEADKKD